jgi:hypothetical protein
MINIHCDHESTQRGNCPFSNPKIEKIYKLIAFVKTLQRLKHDWQKVQPWDQANRLQKLGLVRRNWKKISQIINMPTFFLPFFLLIILWCTQKSSTMSSHLPRKIERGGTHAQLHSNWKRLCFSFPGNSKKTVKMAGEGFRVQQALK